MILRETFRMISIGLALGLADELSASQLVAKCCTGISAQDPLTLACHSPKLWPAVKSIT